jgi:4-amino-4-deoxy-L-arabinose transferase-like glycosyltransferase
MDHADYRAQREEVPTTESWREAMLAGPGETPARERVHLSRPRRIMMAALMSLVGLTFLIPGMTIGYWDRDEAEYAEVAHTMARTGDFLVPRLFGDLYPDKPPFSEWISAISYRWFGESEVSGRLPHVLFSAGACALLFLLGERLYGRRAGIFSALSYATSLLFLIYGRLFNTDSDLVFFTLGTMICVFPILQNEGRWRWATFGGLALGLAFLTKGPLAAIAPACLVIGYVAGKGRVSRASWQRLAALALIGTVVGSTWFILSAIATRGESLKVFLLRDNVYRFFHPMEGHHGPILYYVGVLVLGLFPWSGFLPSLLHKNAWRRDPVRWALFGWGFGLLGFFSMAATKLPHYLLPALPAFSLLIFGPRFVQKERERQVFAWVSLGVGTLLALSIILAACALNLPGYAGGVMVPFIAVGVLSCALPLVSIRRSTRVIATVFALIVAGCIAALTPSELDPARLLPRFGKDTARFRRVGEPVGGLKIDEPALGYYARLDRMGRWDSANQVVEAARLSPTASVLVWLESADGVALARKHEARVQVLESGFNLIDPTAYGKIEIARLSIRPPLKSEGSLPNPQPQ